MRDLANWIFITFIAANVIAVLAFWALYPCYTEMQIVYEMPWNFFAIILNALFIIINNREPKRL